MRTGVKSCQKRGFSLVELAIVMTIVGVIIYTTVQTGMQQLEIAKISQTKAKLQRIQEAIALYYKNYGHLPCPADGTVASSSSSLGDATSIWTDGDASTNATCTGIYRGPSNVLTNVYVGIVPVVDLGLPKEYLYDGWGNRITYISSVHCLSTYNWSASNTHVCMDRSGGSTSNGNQVGIMDKNDLIWAQAAYLLISHGHYGYGAWSKNGGSKPSSAAASATSNYVSNNGNTAAGDGTPVTWAYMYYYDIAFNDGTNKGISSTYFDNIVAWQTAAQINYYANH